MIRFSVPRSGKSFVERGPGGCKIQAVEGSFGDFGFWFGVRGVGLPEI